jgi:hypothetical protein
VIDIIRLIEEQQKQIKDATRKSVAELNIKFAAMSEEELSRFREEVRPAPKAPEWPISPWPDTSDLPAEQAPELVEALESEA